MTKPSSLLPESTVIACQMPDKWMKGFLLQIIESTVCWLPNVEEPYIICDTPKHKWPARSVKIEILEGKVDGFGIRYDLLAWITWIHYEKKFIKKT